MAGYKGQSPRAYQFAKEWQKNAEVARAYLEKASQRMKKWADKRRRPDPFKVGDLVLIKTATSYEHSAEYTERTKEERQELSQLTRYLSAQVSCNSFP